MGRMARSLLRLLERPLDLGELTLEVPQLRRDLTAQIGAQQVVAFAPAPIVRENSAGASDP